MDNLKTQKKLELANCKIHSNYSQELLHLLSEEQSCEEICFKCIQTNLDKYNYSQIVHLNDFLFSDEDTIITNFPPLMDEKVHLSLHRCINLQIDQQIEDIRGFFESLKEKIITLIKQIQTKVDSQINSFQKSKQDLIETYNSLSSKKEIQQIYQKSPQCAHEKILEIVIEKYKNIQTNTEILKQKTKDYLSVFDNISLEKPIQIQNDILLLLKSIQFFPETKINEEQKGTLHEQHDKQKMESGQTNCEIILDLISNKSNYCTQEFIFQIKQLLNKYSKLLNQTHVNSKVWKICDFDKKETFKNMNYLQLENIRILSKKIQQQDELYSNNVNYSIESINRNIQPFSSIISLQNRKYKLNSDLQNLLRSYPIFELENIANCFSIYRINMINSQYDYSNYQKIEQNSNGIEITRTHHSEGFAIAYTDFNLDNDKKYVIRIEFDRNQRYNSFGLIQNNYKDSTFLHDSQLNYNERSNFNDFNKIIKQIPFNQSLNQPPDLNSNLFELRVHLSQKLMRIGTYPQYDKVYELDDKNRIQTDQLYRFATQLGQLNDKITIFDFYTVEQYDNSM